MGSKSSKTASSPTKVAHVEYKPVYEVKRKYNDVHYGDVSLVTNTDTKKDMLLKEVRLTTQEAFDQEIALCEKRADYNHANENVVRMIGYNSISESKFCSSTFKVNIFLEYIEKTLLDHIRNSERELLPFSEIEILYLAENVISCLAYFQTQGISHGDIRPLNIFATETLYKLYDPTVGVLKNSSALISALAGDRPYLAPEVLKLLPTKDFKATYDRARADVFSLGATLLSAATTTHSEDLYNYEKGTIDFVALNNRLEKVKYSYSEFTYNLIKDMLNIDVLSRPDFVQLESRIAPFRDNIKQKLAITPRGVDLDDDILQKAAIQIARSQELRAVVEAQNKAFEKSVFA